jgi:hypothetical protein
VAALGSVLLASSLYSLVPAVTCVSCSRPPVALFRRLLLDAVRQVACYERRVVCGAACCVRRGACRRDVVGSPGRSRRSSVPRGRRGRRSHGCTPSRYAETPRPENRTLRYSRAAQVRKPAEVGSPTTATRACAHLSSSAMPGIRTSRRRTASMIAAAHPRALLVSGADSPDGSVPVEKFAPVELEARTRTRICTQPYTRMYTHTQTHTHVRA